MNVNRKRKRKLTSFIATVIALLMLLIPLAVFAEDISSSDSDTTGSTSESSGSSTASSSSSSGDSSKSSGESSILGSSSSTTENSSASEGSGSDASTESEKTDSSSEEGSGDSGNNSDDTESAKHTEKSTGDNEGDLSEEENSSEESGFDDGSKGEEVKEKDEVNEDGSSKETDKEEDVKDDDRDLEKVVEEISIENDSEYVDKGAFSMEQAESDADLADEETSEQDENSDEVNTDQKFDGNTYSAVIEHIEDHSDYPVDYTEYLGLNELRYFEATITEIGESRVGSAKITVPDDFNLTDGSFIDGISLGYLTLVFSALDGYSLNHDAADYASGWEAVSDNDTGTISLWSKSVDYYLYQGYQVKVGFQAKTPDQITAEAEQKTSDLFVEYDDNGDYKIGIYDFSVTAWTNATTDVLDSEGNRTPLYEDGSNAGEGSGVGVSDDRLNTMSEEHSQLQVWVGDDDFHDAIETYNDDYEQWLIDHAAWLPAFKQWEGDHEAWQEAHAKWFADNEAFNEWLNENGNGGFAVIDSAENSQGEVEYSVEIGSVVDNNDGTFTFNFTITYKKTSSNSSAQAMEELWVIIPDGVSYIESSLTSPTLGNAVPPENGKIVWTGNIVDPGTTTFNLSFNANITGDAGKIFYTEAFWFPNQNNRNNISSMSNLEQPELPGEEPAEPDMPEEPSEPDGVFFPEFTYLQFLGEPVDNNLYIEDPVPDDDPGNGTVPDPDTDPEDPEDPDDTIVLPEIIGPFTPFTTPLAAPPVETPVELPELPVAAAPAAEPVEVVVEEVPEAPQVEVVEPEETQVLPVAELQSMNYWPLLLLLVPGLLWFLWARLVLVRVPNQDGEYKTVARKLAKRKDKRWYVEIGKQLDKHLAEHGEVMVDFRGGLIKEAKKAIYTGETVLSAGDSRFAVINRQRFTRWIEKLNERASRIA